LFLWEATTSAAHSSDVGMQPAQYILSLSEQPYSILTLTISTVMLQASVASVLIGSKVIITLNPLSFRIMHPLSMSVQYSQTLGKACTAFEAVQLFILASSPHHIVSQDILYCNCDMQ
jgi:hypothetical protein